MKLLKSLSILALLSSVLTADVGLAAKKTSQKTASSAAQKDAAPNGSPLHSADDPRNIHVGHEYLKRILKQYVRANGPVSQVDYRALKENSGDLDQYLSAVANLPAEDFNKYNGTHKLSFLMNIYNAATIKLILNHYPVKSIKDIGSILKSPWKKKFFKIAGEEFSLDGLEHDTIRKIFIEPRVHFALVCASIGCPQLRNEPYRADSAALNKQLDEQAKAFLTDTSRNRWDAEKKTLFLSSIFKWYGEDFEKSYGNKEDKESGVKAFVAKYLAKDDAEAQVMKSKDTEIEFLPYDWNLNEVK